MSLLFSSGGKEEMIPIRHLIGGATRGRLISKAACRVVVFVHYNIMTDFDIIALYSTVKRRFKRRQYQRKVNLREDFWATNNFHEIKRQFKRKSI